MDLYCVDNQMPEIQLDPGDVLWVQFHRLTSPPDAMRVVPTLSPTLRLIRNFIADTDDNS